jgi:hypothetical protein
MNLLQTNLQAVAAAANEKLKLNSITFQFENFMPDSSWRHEPWPLHGQVRDLTCDM